MRRRGDRKLVSTTRDPAHESVNLWSLVPVGTTLTAYSLQSTALDLTQWQYDLATGLVTNKVYADGKGTSYTYTSDGKLARRTWARGVATDYGYTVAGELETVNYSDATPDVGYAYDRLGRTVEAITAGVSTNTYSYDVATLARSGETRRTSFSQPETLVRQQDVLGRPAGMTMGGDYAVGYGYDDYGRFGSVASTNTANAVTGQWTYERVPGTDLVAGWQETAGNTWQRSYEAHRDLIAETESGHGANVLDSYGYTNDALGRRAARVDAGVTTNAFGYNLRSEVTSAMLGSDQFGYAYDPIGNRLTATNNAAVTAYFANELNQYTNIVSGVSVTPTYDDDGNMLKFGNGWTAAWDGENRLVQLSKTGEQIGYVYDHQSRRIAKQTAAGTEVFSYDDWAMIRHTAPGGEKADYIYGLDLSGTPQGAGTVGGLLGLVRPGDSAPAGYGYDANGNVTLIAGSDGTVLARYAYDPFGNTLSATGALAAANPFRFSTKYWENEAGLYYYGYRYYAPGLGRWSKRDSLEERGGANLFGFIHNMPINIFDILGLTSDDDFDIGMSIGFSSDLSGKWDLRAMMSTACRCNENLELRVDLEIGRLSFGLGTPADGYGVPEGYEGVTKDVHISVTVLAGWGSGNPTPLYPHTGALSSALDNNYDSSIFYTFDYNYNSAIDDWTWITHQGGTAGDFHAEIYNDLWNPYIGALGFSDTDRGFTGGGALGVDNIFEMVSDHFTSEAKEKPRILTKYPRFPSTLGLRPGDPFYHLQPLDDMLYNRAYFRLSVACQEEQIWASKRSFIDGVIQSWIHDYLSPQTPRFQYPPPPGGWGQRSFLTLDPMR